MQLPPIKKNQALKGKELKGKENAEIGGQNLLILFVMSLLLRFVLCFCQLEAMECSVFQLGKEKKEKDNDKIWMNDHKIESSGNWFQ